MRRVVVAVADVDAAAAFAGRLGDDVDDAVERVGAVERRARPADDLDALDVLHADGQHLPERRPDEVDVHAAAVDEHEHLVGEALVETAERDLGSGPGGLHDVDTGQAPEKLGDLRDAGEPDVLLGDDRRGVGRVEGALRRLRGGDDGLFVPRFELRLGLGQHAEVPGAAGLRTRARARRPTAGLGARARARRASTRLRAGARPRRPRSGGRLRRGLEERGLLLARTGLERGDDLRDLVAVLGVPLKVLLVVPDRVLQVALVDVRARDVVEDVRVRKDVVRLLQLLDAHVVTAVGDLGHALLEVGTGLGSLVGARAARGEDEGAEEEPGGDPCEVSLSHVSSSVE